MNYILTKHAKERYAERIMDRDDRNDIAVFVAQHEDKITQDIEKMLKYGNVLYEGIMNNNLTKIIMNGHWVLIVDSKKGTVITLYEIDLGLGKEFNDIYIQKFQEKIDEIKAEYDKAITTIDEQTSGYRETVQHNKDLIAEYRKNIKSLEQQNNNLTELISEAETNKQIAGQELRDTVSTLIGKKIV